MHSTAIKDRTLWFDGSSSFNPDNLVDLMQQYDIHFVDWMTPLINQYNRQVQKENEIRVKETCDPLMFDWTIPKKYTNLNIVEYVAEKHLILLETCPEHEWASREIRLAKELYNYHTRELDGVLRVIIYVINTLTDNNIVWGVGRGSSVSSYVLYVIGVHDVDSFSYDLDINDFLHD